MANDKGGCTTLLFRGLPRAMGDPRAMDELFRRYGVSDCVKSVKVIPSKGARNVTAALVKVVSVNQVARIAKLFHGLEIGRSMPISVCFASDAVRKQKPLPEEKKSVNMTGTFWEPPRSLTTDSLPTAALEPQRVALTMDHLPEMALGEPQRVALTMPSLPAVALGEPRRVALTQDWLPRIGISTVPSSSTISTIADDTTERDDEASPVATGPKPCRMPAPPGLEVYATCGPRTLRMCN